MAANAMEQEPLSFGTQGALRVILEWRDDYESEGPVGVSWGNLQIWLGDTLVWGQPDASGQVQGISWSWIELLEFLGNAWPYLTEEEQIPITFSSREESPRHIGELYGRAKYRWSKLQEQDADSEESILRDFFVVHDLAEALHGAQPSQLLLLRQGSQILAATTQHEWTLGFAETMSVLEQLCEAIKTRVSHLTDQRSQLAVTRWEKRDFIPPSKRLQIATGFNESLLNEVWPISQDAANDRLYELKAAARMIGNKLPAAQLKSILSKIISLPEGQQFDLGELHQEAARLIDENRNAAPASQGYLLAMMLRKHLHFQNGKVDPKEILTKWGVSIADIDINNSRLDAIAVWGDKQKPTILLNKNGPRTKHPSGICATLAHEICHLLVDIKGALPVAEVLGGNIPHSIEQRANAFAAEFLLPRKEAGDYLSRELKYIHTSDQRFRTTEETIGKLADNYGTSHETTAWQIINSGSAELTPEVKKALDTHLKSIFDPFAFE